MTLNWDSSGSSKVIGHGANWKPIGSFLSDLHCVEHCIVSLMAFKIFDVQVL